MKISLDWLREYVDLPDSPEHLEEILTNVGFPVEASQRVGDDWMFDVEITSNRPDCLGHIGLAREVGAATGAVFKMPAVDYAEKGKDINQWSSVQNEAADLCSRYTARVIEDVKVGQSPGWMQRRLETIGLRSINNIVDITNYVLMEVGQPLHSFDYDRLSQGRIVVRRAKGGEQMVTIDHSKIELTDDMLIIADAAEPVALAGIMGGLASEVGDDTKNILLESAHFNPLSVRRTSRALTLSSESSFRFERNVDMVMVEWASRRAAALLVGWAGGKAASGLIDVRPGGRQERPKVTMRLSRLKKLLGFEIDMDYVLSLFERLGFEPQFDKKGIVTCIIPSWRNDLRREVDLIEEVIRIHGYDKVPTEQKIHINVTTPDTHRRTCEKVTHTLGGCGFFETINVSFVEDRYLQLFGPDGFEPIRVKDLSRKTNNALRHTLLPSLLSARRRNQDAGNGRCDIYELSAVHQPDGNGQMPKERIMLALLSDGDFRELRGAVEAVIGALDKNAALTFKPQDVLWAQKGSGTQMLLAENSIGYIGKANEKIIKAYDLEHELSLAEICFDELVKLEGAPVELEPLMRFPAINRDLSLIVDEAVTWDQIEQLILKQQIEQLCSIQFVGIYRGKGIDPGKKSLTLTLVFRLAEKTLTHEEVDEHQEKILAELTEHLSAQIRT